MNNLNQPVQTIVHPKKVVYGFDFPAESETAFARNKITKMICGIQNTT